MSHGQGSDATVADAAAANTEVGPGDRIGKYVVIDRVGEGAMGVVVRAFDSTLARTVALKLVHPGRAGAHEDAARARLVAEARALARIAHPNVVAVFEVGSVGERVFVAMELVVGVDLQIWLRAHRRSWREVVALFVPLTRGLAAVHAAGLVHRDIKPANILVGDDGRVRIGDFGIARATGSHTVSISDGEQVSGDLSDERVALTAEGMIVGTPAYMAPEQHRLADVGAAADQYALCVALYEALWGERPFRGDTRRLLALKLRGPNPPTDDRGVPRWLYAAIARGLAPEPSERHADMTALGDALARDPARGRRRVAIATIATACAMGAAAFAVARPGPCDASAAAIDPVWDRSRATTVETALTASTRAHAAATAARSIAFVDAQVDAWRAMAEDACRAARVRGEQSERLFDRRVACLDARRRELAAAIDVLAQGGDEVVDRAGDVLATVRPIAGCGDLAALEAGVAPPDDAAQKAEIDGVRDTIAASAAARAAGRIDAALAGAIAACAEAERIAYEPLLAEAELARGEAEELAGKPTEAAATLDHALWIAIGSGDDRTAARLAAALTWHAGDRDRDVDAAARWAALARALDRRAGTDPTLAATLHTALGSAFGQSGRWDDAAREFAAARELWAAADDTRGLLGAEMNLAILEYRRGHDVRATFEALLPRFEAEFGVDHFGTLRLRNVLGLVLYDAGELARADEIQRELVARRRELADGAAPELAIALFNWSLTLKRAGRIDEALAAGAEALPIFERVADVDAMSRVLEHMGAIYRERGSYDAAAQTLARALELCDRRGDAASLCRVAPQLELAEVATAQGRHADAEARYADAWARALAAFGPNSRFLVQIEIGRAELARARGDLDAALAGIDRARERIATTEDVMLEDLPRALAVRAEILLALGRGPEAVRACEEGLAALRGSAEHITIAELEDIHADVLASLGRRDDAAAARARAAAERERRP